MGAPRGNEFLFASIGAGTCRHGARASGVVRASNSGFHQLLLPPKLVSYLCVSGHTGGAGGRVDPVLPDDRLVRDGHVPRGMRAARRLLRRPGPLLWPEGGARSVSDCPCQMPWAAASAMALKHHHAFGRLCCFLAEWGKHDSSPLLHHIYITSFRVGAARILWHNSVGGAGMGRRGGDSDHRGGGRGGACPFTAFSQPCHCLFTALPLPFHCHFTAVHRPCHCLFTAFLTAPCCQNETANLTKSVKQLTHNYLTSVGRASNLILNIAPDGDALR